MFKTDDLAGSLIKSGKFKEAIEKFGDELRLALYHGVVTNLEVFGVEGIIHRFNKILLNPSDIKDVNKLGNDMLYIAIRIPNYVKKVTDR